MFTNLKLLKTHDDGFFCLTIQWDLRQFLFNKVAMAHTIHVSFFNKNFTKSEPQFFSNAMFNVFLSSHLCLINHDSDGNFTQLGWRRGRPKIWRFCDSVILSRVQTIHIKC